MKDETGPFRWGSAMIHVLIKIEQLLPLLPEKDKESTQLSFVCAAQDN